MTCKAKKTMAAGAAMAMAFATAAMAAEATFDTSLWSKYIWRGQLYTDDPVLQPSLDVSTDFGLGFNAWMNLDLTDVNTTPEDDTRGHPNEIDFAVRYGLPLKGPLQIEVGAGTYVISMPTGANGTTADGYLKLQLDPGAAGDSWFAALPTPTLAAYYEFLEIEDFYFNFGLEKSCALSETLALSLGASVGYGMKDYNAYFFDPSDFAPEGAAYEPVDSDAFNDLNVTASLTWQATATVSFSLMAQYTALIEDPVKSAAALRFGDDAWFIGGAKAAWSF
jgi:hypothetical protein